MTPHTYTCWNCMHFSVTTWNCRGPPHYSHITKNHANCTMPGRWFGWGATTAWPPWSPN